MSISQKKFYFGATIRIKNNNMIDAAKKIKEAGGNFLQIFLSLPSQKLIEKQSEKELYGFKKYLKDNDMKVVIHASYTYNIAADWDEYAWWIINLEIEIEHAYKMGAMGIVLHTGNQLNLPLWKAINNMYTSLIYIHNKTKKYKDVKIILETPSGQGTELLYKLEEFSKFYRKFAITENTDIKDRFGVCLDTCHVFAAGYDLKNKNKIKIFLETFDELIGIKNLKVIHFNDAVEDVGSRLDRHATIGDGKIGLRNMKYLFKYFKKYKIPTVLETPWTDIKKELYKLI